MSLLILRECLNSLFSLAVEKMPITDPPVSQISVRVNYLYLDLVLQLEHCDSKLDLSKYHSGALGVPKDSLISEITWYGEVSPNLYLPIFDSGNYVSQKVSSEMSVALPHILFNWVFVQPIVSRGRAGPVYLVLKT